MSDVPAVELRNATKAYAAGVRAVDGVNLRVPAGSVVALLGPSGCGKTTTLRLINRLEDATSGEVLVRGQDVRSVRPETLRRSIGYVIQEGGLLPHLDVSANVATVPGLLGWPRERIRRRVGEVLDLVGLPESEYGRRRPAELSGGQRQRVGVARALAADPDLLLMDEPFGALDPGTRETIHDELLQLLAHLHKTVVLVTHDIAEAGRLAERIVLMDRGQVVQEGDLHDLLVRPADARTRNFLGQRRTELALNVLKLGQVVRDIPGNGAGDGVRLAADLPLGRVLEALAGLPGDAAIVIAGDVPRRLPARALLDRICADLAAAGAED